MFMICIDLFTHQAYCLCSAVHPNVDKKKHKLYNHLNIKWIEPLLNKIMHKKLLMLLFLPSFKGNIKPPLDVLKASYL
jgi:hypothetical protein